MFDIFLDGELFFKKDETFCLPRAIVNIHLQSEIVSVNRLRKFYCHLFLHKMSCIKGLFIGSKCCVHGINGLMFEA